MGKGRPSPPRPDASQDASHDSRSQKLLELRARIRAVIERSGGGRTHPEPPRRDDADLPFALERTSLGPLYVRELRLLPSHRTGRASVLPSRDASSELLALLALDPSLSRCAPRRALYIDTETTGLRGGTGTLAFLVGLAFWEDGGEGGDASGGSTLVVEQLLLRSPGEEAPILDRLAARIRAASVLVSFNGKAFDLPLLRTRFAMARMPLPIEPPHLDLVHVARRIHKGSPGACKLTALEERVLGFVRENDVPSGEVSACYLHFLRTGDARAILGVVEHNAWDVVAMASLVGLYGEPLETTALSARDLVGVARTLFRAGEKNRGLAVVERAVLGGAGDSALLARAEMRKRMGSRARALADFEAMATRGDDPYVQLELAKLYEHFAKDPVRALAACQSGTGESPEATTRRLRRLERKIARADAKGQKALGF
jgi:uncharacterized protein YprB with RNaseH-like and TPR domain